MRFAFTAEGSNEEKVAVFGTNRTNPTFVFFDCSVKEFEHKLDVLIMTASEKKQPMVNIDPTSAFWLDDFYKHVPKNPKDLKEGTVRVYDLYANMRVITLAEFNYSFRNRKTFLKG